MENLSLMSSPKAKIVLGVSSYSRNSISSKPLLSFGTISRHKRTSISLLAAASLNGPRSTKLIVAEKLRRDNFAGIISSGSQHTSNVQVLAKVFQNGSAPESEEGFSQGTTNPQFSQEDQIKMFIDPASHQILIPYLLEEWSKTPPPSKTSMAKMLRDPVFRHETKDLVEYLWRSLELDEEATEFLKNLDIFDGPEVKLLCDLLGLTREEMFAKMLSNLIRVEPATVDCYENPLGSAKYQNNKEVTYAFNQMEDIFPELLQVLHN